MNIRLNLQIDRRNSEPNVRTFISRNTNIPHDRKGLVGLVFDLNAVASSFLRSIPLRMTCSINTAMLARESLWNILSAQGQSGTSEYSCPSKTKMVHQPGFFVDFDAGSPSSLFPLLFVAKGGVDFLGPYQSTSLRLSLRARGACRPDFSARLREGL